MCWRKSRSVGSFYSHKPTPTSTWIGKNPNPGPENLGEFGQGLRDKRSLRKSSWTAKFSKNSPKEDGREREMRSPGIVQSHRNPRSFNFSKKGLSPFAHCCCKSIKTRFLIFNFYFSKWSPSKRSLTKSWQYL